MSQMNTENNKFLSLIQPIKDLAANWDIDIAENLNDYLEDLEQLKISLDGGQTQLNFAEAALLIQGSTTVYSKKVEYLHQLVLKSLEFITQKKAAPSKAGANNVQDNQSIEDDIMNFGDDPSFLLLDHLVEEGQNIDMKPIQKAEVRDRMSSESSKSSHAANASRISLSLMHSMLNDDNGNSTLKLMSSSYIDANGALILGAFRPSYFKPLIPLNQGGSAGNSGTNTSPTEVDNFATDNEMLMNDNGDDGGMMWDNNNDDHGGYDMPYDNNHHPATDAANEMHMDIPMHPEIAPAPSVATTVAAAKPMVNRFGMLDPHQVIAGSRPVRKGRPYKYPPTAESKMSVRELIVEKFVLKDIPRDPIADILRGDIPVKGLFDPCFFPLQQLKKKIERRQRLLEIRQRNIPAEAGNIIADNGDDRANPLNEISWHQRGGIDNFSKEVSGVHAGNQEQHPLFQDMDYDGADDGYYMDEPFVGDQGDGNYPPMDDQLISQGPERKLFPTEDEIREEEELSRRLDAALQEDLVGKSKSSSYEMICRQYIEGFHRGANAFARETQLSKRVNDWTMRLEPILLAQEDAEPFDILAYSDRVLMNMKNITARKKRDQKKMNKETIGFSQIVAGQSSAEVCRIFLACLQLANLGNVEVLNTSTNANGVVDESFALKLLQEKRNNGLDDFLAPSVMQHGMEV